MRTCKRIAMKFAKRPKRFSHCSDIMWQLGATFSTNTSIHGIPHIFSHSIGRRERFLWLVAFVASLCLLIYTNFLVAFRYRNKQFETIIANPKYPIYKLPFPEVTVCNENRLNWLRLEQAQQKFLLPEHRHSHVEQLFSDIVAAYDTLVFGQFTKFSKLAGRPLHLLDYVNFTIVVQFMAWRCDELFADCRWGDETLNCCDVFAARISQSGSCLAFNSVETDMGRRKKAADKYYPWHVAKSGPDSALSFTVQIREHQHYPKSNNRKGVTIMVTEPYVWFNYPVFVATNSKAEMALNPMYMYHAEHTKRVPTNVRQCVFDYEMGSQDFKTFEGHKYMIENCQSKCLQEYLVRYCNCSMDLFFPVDSLPVCKARDLPCLAKHNVYFQSMEHPKESAYVRKLDHSVSMQCDCFHNCNFLSYSSHLHVLTLGESQMSTNDSRVDFQTYFNRENVVLYRTQLKYTWLDCLASFGGIAGLFLGCSVISIVEISYLFFMDIPKTVWHEYRNSQRSRWMSKKSSKGVAVHVVARPTIIYVQ